jgi:hypothetical protein
MKAILIVAIALLALSGCASHSSYVAPYYDQSSNAVIAEGFPVGEIYVSKDFDISGYPSGDTFTGFSFFGKSAESLEVLYMTRAGDYDESEFLKGGYEKGRIKNADIYHRFYRGLYSDLAPNHEAATSDAPTCGVGTSILVADNESKRFMVVAYVEGWDCERMDDFGNYHKYNLKIAALKASGLI